MALCLVPLADGVRVHRGEDGPMLCHVTTKWGNDDHRGGVMSWEPLPREQWFIRLAHGTMTFGDLEEMLSLMPT